MLKLFHTMLFIHFASFASDIIVPFVFDRPEMVVGWYHSHPGFGCWLSGVDINTQQSFEALSERAVAVVVDPIQSVKGKVSCRNSLKLFILVGLLPAVIQK
jgi:hypothetical protein